MIQKLTAIRSTYAEIGHYEFENRKSMSIPINKPRVQVGYRGGFEARCELSLELWFG